MQSALKREIPKCLPAFRQVKRFWDHRHQMFLAKILPGEYYVTLSTEEGIATTLGSCVSACIWDEKLGIGGMNHFMLPLTTADASQVRWGNELSDATRYGNYAMEHLINDVISNGGLRKNLKAKVFGGGELLGDVNNVGKRNSEFVLEYLGTERIPILSQDLCGTHPRRVVFVPSTGRVLIRKMQTANMGGLVKYEKKFKDEIKKTLDTSDVELF